MIVSNEIRAARALLGWNLDVLYDDRTASAGEKFADAELLGAPLRLTVGKRSVESGRARGAGPARAREAQRAARGCRRRGGGAVARAPLTTRRLLGLDRSGGPPPETRRQQPLNPWTIPNAIGFVRIALIPVFLVLALEFGRRARAPRPRSSSP